MTKIVCAFILLAACDKPQSESTASSSSATITQTTAAPAIATAAPTVSGSAWTSYLPDYPGATVTNKTADFATLETKDAPDKVVAFYKDKLAGAGFPPGASGSLGAKGPGQPTVITTSKGSAMVQVTVTPVQGTTKISLSIM